MSKRYYNSILLTLDADRYDELSFIAYTRGTNTIDLVREVVENYIDKQEVSSEKLRRWKKEK